MRKKKICFNPVLHVSGTGGSRDFFLSEDIRGREVAFFRHFPPFSAKNLKDVVRECLHDYLLADLQWRLCRCSHFCSRAGGFFGFVRRTDTASVRKKQTTEGIQRKCNRQNFALNISCFPFLATIVVGFLTFLRDSMARGFLRIVNLFGKPKD